MIVFLSANRSSFQNSNDDNERGNLHEKASSFFFLPIIISLFFDGRLLTIYSSDLPLVKLGFPVIVVQTVYFLLDIV